MNSPLSPVRAVWRWSIGLGLPLALLSPLLAQRITLVDAKDAPVVVESVAISAEVTGRLAVTTFDLVFHNPNNRVLEGTFEFPLLEGQSVVRFALDVDGRLREAVPVEKEKGRVVFEEIVRRGVDPGLLEQTAGNTYRARIYPIPARGSRRVVIAFQEDLMRHASGAAAYRLALDFPDTLKRFRLAATVLADATAPARASTTLALELPPWREARVLEVERRDFVARGLFELELPAVSRARVTTQSFRGGDYFYAEVPAGALAGPARPAPKVVGLLWDASGSGRERDHEREFALLEAWFAAVPNVEVRLVLLRDRASPAATFRVRDGDWSALRSALAATVYDGATSWDGLVDDPAVAEWMLFTDGHVNYGTTPAAAKLPLSGVVHAVASGTGADGAFLRGLAARHAGEFVDLPGLEAGRAAARLRTFSLRVLEVERDPEAVAQVFPEAGAPVSGETFAVTGILRRSSATVRLRIGHSATDARSIELKLRAGENAGSLAARAWATAKIIALSTDHAANREDIRRTSREFGIVTADTSLIVLETVEDYVRYEIEPPEELRRAWTDLRRSAAQDRDKDERSHLDEVAEAFAAKVAWWETKFPKGTPPREQPSLLKGDDDRPGDPRVFEMGGPQRPSPSATLAAPSPADEGTGGEDERIELDSFVVAAASERGFVAGRASFAAAAGSGDGDESVPGATIALRPWSPDAAYLDRLRRAAPGDRYAVYLEERAENARQPGFFLDVAGFFFEHDEAFVALQVLSNLAELGLEDAALLRVLGHRLVQAGHPELALPLFERVLVIRGEEPQSRRDLALVCAVLGRHQRAVDLLGEVVARRWDDRFPNIGLIALGELNAIVATCGQTLDLTRIDRRLRRNLPVGLRVILTWDANDCDIDLWVDDPNGETAMYNHPLTYQGGRMSNDFTGGYGPEEFLLRDPKPGTYRVRINYFGDRRQSALGPVTAQVRLITGFGTPAEKEERLTVRLKEGKETLEIGSIEIVGK